jgi:hypothetical protein
MEKPIFKSIIEDIIAYETFENMSDTQFFDNITIYLNIPISEICFNIEDSKIALQILTIKSLSGFNDPLSDYNFYINNKIIDKDDLLLSDDNPYNYIESFVKKYEKDFLIKNSIKIEFINPANFEYVKHIKIEKK